MIGAVKIHIHHCFKGTVRLVGHITLYEGARIVDQHVNDIGPAHGPLPKKLRLLLVTKNLRRELQPHGIKVTAVIAGAVYTDSWKGSGVEEQRIMEPEDIAKMIYAASQLSPQAVVEELVIRPQLGDL